MTKTTHIEDGREGMTASKGDDGNGGGNERLQVRLREREREREREGESNMCRGERQNIKKNKEKILAFLPHDSTNRTVLFINDKFFSI